MTYLTKSLWYEPIVLGTIDDDDIWNSLPASAGVYVIMRDSAIPRIGGVDDMGIIYIGKSENLRERLWKFWTVKNHIASDFLWTHPTLAQAILNSKHIKKAEDVEKYLGKIKARYCAPIDRDFLEEAERTLLFTYIEHFGEAPPLNLSLPRRWHQLPAKRELRWAQEGLCI